MSKSKSSVSTSAPKKKFYKKNVWCAEEAVTARMVAVGGLCWRRICSNCDICTVAYMIGTNGSITHLIPNKRQW